MRILGKDKKRYEILDVHYNPIPYDHFLLELLRNIKVKAKDFLVRVRDEDRNVYDKSISELDLSDESLEIASREFKRSESERKAMVQKYREAYAMRAGFAKKGKKR